MKVAVNTAKEKFGRLDVLVNSAGIAAATLVYDDRGDYVHPLEDFQYVVNVRFSLRILSRCNHKN
jgi:3-hydroxyacyl-CoA dehydrogenase/3-hydroxy-2-methylbutyryl-CoA dehydrogenase